VTGVFAEWQPAYAQRGIATFPVTAHKKPAVSNYAKFGLPASNKIISRFASADALGFMCGKRSGITVLDVDSTDEKVLADALDRHGKTPIIVRSGSGNHQAWYRHGGERRIIRPWGRALPIDLLRGGYVVAPPSRVEKGEYQFIEGSLDDLGNLPTLEKLRIEQPALIAIEPPAEWAKRREGEGRNNELFRLLRRAAQKVDDFDQLLEYARTQNDKFAQPMADEEVLKVANSVWAMKSEGRNRFGQIGAWVPLELMRTFKSDLVTLGLYSVLRAENGPNSIFPIANAMAKSVGLSLHSFRESRKKIVRMGLVEQISPDTQHKPAQYRWAKPVWRDCSERSGVRNLTVILN